MEHLMQGAAQHRGNEPWQKRRLLSLSLWLGIGVWLGRFFGHAPALGWALVGVAALLYAALFFWKLPRRNAALFGCFALGVALMCTAYPAWADDPWIPDGAVQVSGTIAEIGQGGERYTPLVLRDVTLGQGKTPISGGVRVLDTTQTQRFVAGQRISFSGTLSMLAKGAFLGDYDQYSYGIIENIRFVSYAQQITVETTAVENHSLTLRLRRWVADAVLGNLPWRTAAVTYALLCGDQSYLDVALLEAVRRAGVLHLLVVSGMHISVSAGGSYALLRRVRAPKWCAGAVALAVMCFYVLITGWTASVARAVIMWCVWMLGQLSGRRYDAPSGLAAAFFLSMMLAPMDLFRLGFQLSYAATGAILFLLPALHKRPTRWPAANGLLTSLAMSLCAGVGTLPFLMAGFGQVSLLAPLINLLAAPVAMALLAVGALLAAAGGWTVFAQGVGTLTGWVAEPALTWVAGQRFDVVYTAPPALGMAVVLLALLALLSPKVADFPRRYRRAAAVLAAVLTVLLLLPVNASCQYPQAATVISEKNAVSVAWRNRAKAYVLCAGDGQNAAAFAQRAYGGRVEGLLVVGREPPGGQILADFDGMDIGTLYVPAAWLAEQEYVDILFAAQKRG
ncbi:MAG: ComEC/Rec2 family competence protein, partial [Eubacteriales bacterium]|nr:ComEC/Rec2 family competence protein [Eubacteriales bacterium]